MMLDQTFEAVVFDWDGTAVADRQADATHVRSRVEALCAAGVHVVVISGTHVGNVDGQLQARPSGPGSLLLCLNRGSEVFTVTQDGLSPTWARTATEEEDRALDLAAATTVAQLRARGVAASVVSERLNRRKIDLIADPEWADPPKARIAELLVAVSRSLDDAGIAGLAEVVAMATEAARSAGLADPRVTSDVKHVEIGLTDKADAARWTARWLAASGITGRLVLLGGDEFAPIGGVPGSDSLMVVPELARAVAVSVGAEPGGVPDGVAHLGGGPARFLELLDEQLARRARRRVPMIDDDPAWIVPLPEDVVSLRVAESLGALGNGWVGARATLEEDGAGTEPLFIANGVYTADPVPRLLEGPVWMLLPVHRGGRGGRQLDLRTGIVARVDDGSSLRSMRFISTARPHAMALRAEAPPSQLGIGDPLTAADAAVLERNDRDDVAMARTTTPDGGGIAVAARDRHLDADGLRTIERIASWAADPTRPPSWEEVAAGFDEAELVGFEQLLAEHRVAWAQRWADAEVTIEGSVDDQLAARFAVFHLLNAAPDAGEAAIGPRGLTGHGYGGHVFWDADVFVLPALAAIRPAAARAMVEYRIQRLPAARSIAAGLGLRGARFPWESAAHGSDVTPRSTIGRQGEMIPIRTGDQEEHIVADVAWAAHEYAAWTGDEKVLAGAGRDLILDTARYWASRVRIDGAGVGHLYGLMGPDEYHEVVDDNAYSNVMARWNLRRAAQLAEEVDAGDPEAAQWRDLADTLADGWDAAYGLYEQFAGYWALEPLLAESVAQRPFAADMVLGSARVAGSQLIKQPDVLMLHHLVPDEVEPRSLAANLAFYEPRTTHGSSLSPAIHAALLARAGQPEHALALFRLAAHLDLDDLTGTTAGGLHLATMGGVWQALAYGFLGLRPRGHTLQIDPCLPAAWQALGLGLHFRGAQVHVRATHAAVDITCDAPISVQIANRPPLLCAPPSSTFPLDEREGRIDEGTRP